MSLQENKQSSQPLLGAQAVHDEAARPYHGCWRLLEASGAPTPVSDPALAEVSVALRFAYLVLRAPGMLRLDIPLDVIEDDDSVLETVNLEGEARLVADEGAWAAEWFSRVLGRPVRLVKRVQDTAS